VITSEISAEDELELVSWMDAGDSRAKDEGGVPGCRRRARKAVLKQVHYCKSSIAREKYNVLF